MNRSEGFTDREPESPAPVRERPEITDANTGGGEKVQTSLSQTQVWLLGRQAIRAEVFHPIPRTEDDSKSDNDPDNTDS